MIREILDVKEGFFSKDEGEIVDYAEDKFLKFQALVATRGELHDLMDKKQQNKLQKHLVGIQIIFDELNITFNSWKL